MSDDTFTKTAREIIEPKKLNLDGLEQIAIVLEIQNAIASAYNDGYHDAAKAAINAIKNRAI